MHCKDDTFVMPLKLRLYDTNLRFLALKRATPVTVKWFAGRT